MAKIRAFTALRPDKPLAEKIAALPYDVYSTKEAREAARDNSYSFLHVDKAEIDLSDDTNPYDDSVYAKAAINLQKMVKEGWLKKDSDEMLYIYKLEWAGRSQTGIVGLTSIDEYLDGTIKKHEFTREDKENDRIRHIQAVKAHTGPIFLAYKANKRVSVILSNWMNDNELLYDMTFDDGTKNTVWAIDDNAVISEIVSVFGGIKNLFIADGHHRNAAAVKVGLLMREQNPSFTGEEQYNHYLSVMFPDDELYIMDYNRVVADINGLSADEFLSKLSEKFTVSPSAFEVSPTKRHEFGMCLFGKWYTLNSKPEYLDESDVLKSLDVSILQEFVLEPVLGIYDIRTNKRIDFIGGIRGLSEISERIESGEMAVGFSMFPTSMRELMDVAESDQIMPPKSTWFEPKLRSGIFIHEI